MATRSRRWYVSLDALKNELGIAAATTTHDAKLSRYIERASAWVDATAGWTFIPVTETRYFDWPTWPRQALYLRGGNGLLAITTLSDDEGVIDASDYVLYPLNGYPKQRIELIETSRFWYYSDTRKKAISILGRWGYSEDYDDTGATLGAAITSTSATTFTASSGTLLQVGWGLLVDTEQMFVSGISGNTITVLRGNNGTTAATHSNAATIYRYVPALDIEGAVALLGSMWYGWRDSGGVKSKKIGDFSVTYQDGYPFPDTVIQTVELHSPII